MKEFFRNEFFEPDVSRALVVTTGLVVPLAVAYYLGNPGAGIFVGITAQLITSARIGRSYPERAVILLVGTVALAGAAFAGTLSGASVWTAVLFIGLVAGLASLARGIGDYGQVFGLSAVILFLISLRAPHTLDAAVQRGTLIGVGGAWAAVLSLFRWPFRPNLPFYLALGKPWHYSSRLMELAAAELAPPGKRQPDFYQPEGGARKALNDVLPWLRKKRRGTATLRREALKLVRASSRFGSTALALHTELAGGSFAPEDLPTFRAATEALAGAGHRVAGATVRQSRWSYARAQAAVEAAGEAIGRLEGQVGGPPRGVEAHLKSLHLVALLESALRYLHDALLMLRRMEQNRKKPAPDLMPDLATRLRRRWAGVRKQLQPGSLLLQHSLRVALMAAAGIAVYYGLDIPRGYWIVLTVMILLQPEFGSTWEKTRDRLLGTMAGALLGTGLLMRSTDFHFSFLITAIAGCCFLFVYFQPKNYKLSVVFVTVMLVAMLEVAEEPDWRIAAYRLLATTIGGVLALGASYLLWPRWESVQFPQLMAKALQANRNYLLQIGHELQSQSGFHPRVVADQRKAEVSALNALESTKRLQLERGWRRGNTGNARKLAEHSQHLTRELTALAAFLPRLRTDRIFPETSQLVGECAQVLDELSAAITAGQPFTGPLSLDPLLAAMETRLIPHGPQAGSAPPTGAEQLPYELVYSHLKSIAREITAMARLAEGGKGW